MTYLERLPGAELIAGLAAWPGREQAQGKANEARLAGEAVIASRIDQPPQPELAPDDGQVAGDIIYTRLTPIVQTEMAMLLLDIVQSTGMIQRLGDTVFMTGIMRLHRALSTHPLAGEMRFLKCTGDGFLAAYGGVMAAVAVAQSLRFALRDESSARRRAWISSW